VPLHQSGANVGCPPKPKQPPQILPKPPSGQPSSGSHTKIAANSRSSTGSQHQGTFCYSDSTCSELSHVTGFCESDNEPSGSIKMILNFTVCLKE
jgi:hypothetical protein